MAPALQQPYISPQTLSSSSTARFQISAPLARALCDDVILEGTMTVTGTITASTTFDANGLQRVLIGSENRPLAVAQTGELAFLIDSQIEGVSTGSADGLTTTPTTATALSLNLRLKGPWDLSKYANPIVYLDFDPSQFGTISAFALTLRVTQTPWSGKMAKRVIRGADPAATGHKIFAGPQVVNQIALLIGAGGALNETYLYDENNNLVVSYSSSDRCQILAAAWASYKQAALAASPTKYLVRRIISVPYANRFLTLALASSQTALAFFGCADV